MNKLRDDLLIRFVSFLEEVYDEGFRAGYEHGLLTFGPATDVEIKANLVTHVSGTGAPGRGKLGRNERARNKRGR